MKKPKITKSLKLKIISIFGTFCIIFNCFSQSEYTKYYCAFDGQTITDIEFNSLKKNNFDVSTSSIIYDYFQEIIDLDDNSSGTRIILRDIRGKNSALSHAQRIEDIGYPSVITINFTYYASILDNFAPEYNKYSYKKALILFILAHEYEHLMKHHLGYQISDVASNYAKEITADIEAGFIVGTLTNIDIGFFGKILPLVLYDIYNSKTHPPSSYRILAASVGWIKAKLKNTNKFDTDDGFTYKKEIYDSYVSWGRYKKNYQSKHKFSYQSDGIYCIDYNDKDMYVGYVENKQKQGQGFYIDYGSFPEIKSCFLGYWSNDSRNHGLEIKSNGDRYEGNWSGRLYHGEGIYTWSNGDVYIGEWKDGKKNGKGSISESGIFYEGYWKDDVYCGTKECD